MTQQQTDAPQVVLTVAGLDPSGGAGIVADVRTFAAFGCFATAAVTSLTFQNTVGVSGASHQSAEVVRAQVLPVVEDFRVAAWKTGMLPTREVIEEVARLARETGLRDAPLVVDPVVRSTSGHDLIDDEALDALRRELLPLARVVTPNAPEAERLSGLTVIDGEGMLRAARMMREMGARAVLVKGGHMKGPSAVDVLDEGGEITYYTGPRIETTSTHGTGCTMAAAITACLARGLALDDAVGVAKRFVGVGLRRARALGRGHGPVSQDARVEFTPDHVFIDGE
ncbi:MAG: bifunctional hydroxymethylpyrimidine kinase/phosphomethylpyrimidine kinase [Acidobacteriota bacterium]|nr:bifunctional hydroxymethylpyrimidine kinase/phosphomethylpyrimidine kinase [Acidobacteriota bacterium]